MCRWLLSERDKEARLLKWYRRRQRKTAFGRVSMGEFDAEYRKLFGVRPLWYSWRYFYRDHGFVGMQESGLK